MANRVKVTLNDRELRLNIRQMSRKLDDAVGRVVDVNATRGQGYLKTDAPWTDRTGAARTGLHTVADHQGSKHEITFAHSVHYGFWLEVKYSGRDEVIMPTVRKTGRELMADLNGLMGRLA